MTGNAGCKLDETTLESLLDLYWKAAYGLKEGDPGPISLESFDEGSAWTLLHAGIAGQDGLLGVGVGGRMSERDDSGQEARGSSGVAEVEFLALGRGCQSASATVNDEGITPILPFKAGTL